jgi:peptide deformylase
MKKAEITLFGDPVLRETARPVRAFGKKLGILIGTIQFTLRSRPDGAALAAPQVAVSKRVTVIDYMDEYIEMINPEIVGASGTQSDVEGCLSLPGFLGTVKRAETVRVKFQDRAGREKTIERSGKMARCIQHEIDHLDGILFIDRMEDEFVVNSFDGRKLSVREMLNASPPEGLRSVRNGD